MFLSTLKIWNFRKYSTSDTQDISKENAGVSVEFKKGLNLLVGENDSGKTAIVDGIKFVLGTQSFDYLRIEENDFHTGKKKLKIECEFILEGGEAGYFLEWTSLREIEEEKKFLLKVWLIAEIRNNRIITDIRAGQDEIGTLLDGEARDLLRVTYLKPLRDAELELQSGYKSRLANILRNHHSLKRPRKEDGSEDLHELEKHVKTVNEEIEAFFHEDTGKAKDILSRINKHSLIDFHSKRAGKGKKSMISISGKELIDILRSLNLNYEEKKSGLGAQNLLFIATELLLLNQSKYGLKLCLIEEIEAHLHVQAQMRLIEYLQKQAGQFILTTHSISLASKVSLDNVIICKDSETFPMWVGRTELSKSDYDFLSKFLDDTKANLFFAEGVIIVEGIAEAILVPAIAEKIGLPLHQYGISIVNVGSKALSRFAKIFMRTDGKELNIPVSCITDLDIKQILKRKNSKTVVDQKGKDIKVEIEKLKTVFNKKPVNVFHSPLWTMEFDIACSKLFMEKMWLSIRLARLTKSREKENIFKPLTKTDFIKANERAKIEVEEWLTKYDNDFKRVAFEIYKPLDNNSASKAVAAYYFSNFLKIDITKEELENDLQIKNIVHAIKHVCNGY